MEVAFTPEHESLGLVNSMHRTTTTSICEVSREFQKSTLTDMRSAMLKSSDDQTCFVAIVCDVLDEHIFRNDSQQVQPDLKNGLSVLTKRSFQGNTRSEISIYHGDRMEFKASYYIMRIARHSEASPSCFIVALIYIERFRKKRPLIALSSKTMQRLLLIASMIAFKYLEDAAIENARWYLQRCYTLFQSSPI